MAPHESVDAKDKETLTVNATNGPSTSPGDNESLVWHKTRLRVPLFEVDLGQAVYHGNYYHLFEQAREAFLRHLGLSYKWLMDRQLHLAVVEATCNYRRSLRYDDLVEIHTAVAWLRRRSLSFVQLVYREEEGVPVLCTRASLNLVCVHFSGKAKPLPQELVQALARWMAGDGSA